MGDEVEPPNVKRQRTDGNEVPLGDIKVEAPSATPSPMSTAPVTVVKPEPVATVVAQSTLGPSEIKAEPSSSVPSSTSSQSEIGCGICGQGGDLTTCAGLCGLRAHTQCVGPEALYPSILGSVCGSCAILQQNRSSNDDLSKGGVIGLSVRRAILWLNSETNAATNFDKYGHLTSLRLQEIAQIAGYPIKPFAEKFVEHFLQKWMREKLANAANWKVNVRDIFTLLIGLHSMKEASIAHELKRDVVNLIEKHKFTVTDLLGWHPSIEGPHTRCSSLCAVCGIRNPPEVHSCTQCGRQLVFPSIFTKYASGLLATYYAERVGISLGTTTVDVFSHTNTIRLNYKGLLPFDADGLDWEGFSEQLRMIFGLLDIVSNFGVLQLSPEHFEPEIKILFNPVYINHAILIMDFDVVGKFLQSMRLFGLGKSSENFNLISLCEQFILYKQGSNGSWCKMNGSPIDRYKATVTCAKALMQPAFQGFGPFSSDVQRYLEKWTRQSSKTPSMQEGNEKRLVCGATLRSRSKDFLKRMEAHYKRTAGTSSADSQLDHLVTVRFSALKRLHIEQPKLDSQSSVAEHMDDQIKEEDEKANDDDDELTTLSLNEDLAIFDGLRFEDGDVIDLSQQQAQAADDADENRSEVDASENANRDDGAANEVYDDDDDDAEEQTKANSADEPVEEQPVSESKTLPESTGLEDTTTVTDVDFGFGS